jgi:hypothetical protein
MKAINIFFLIAFPIIVSAKAVLCQTTSPENSCLEVEAFFKGEKWVPACGNDYISPDSSLYIFYDCRAGKQEAIQSVSFSYSLTNQNAYIKFTQGYRVWILVNEHPETFYIDKALDVETLREYLPSARLCFLQDMSVEMIKVKYSNTTEFVIQKPETDEELLKEIIFPQVSTKLLNDEKKRSVANIVVYPNPVNDELKVSIDNGLSIAEVRVLSRSMELLKKHLPEEKSKNISLDLIAIDSNEIYFLLVIDSQGRRYFKRFLKS